MDEKPFFKTEIARMEMELHDHKGQEAEIRLIPKPEGNNIFPTFDNPKTANQAHVIEKELKTSFGESRCSVAPGLDHRKIMITPDQGQSMEALLKKVTQALSDIAKNEHVVAAGKNIRSDDGTDFIQNVLERYHTGEIDYHRGFAEILGHESLKADARREAFNALKAEEDRQQKGGSAGRQ